MKPTEFIECDACRSKPGTPVLCVGCLNNRTLISDLKDDMRRLEKRIERVKVVLEAVLILCKP